MAERPDRADGLPDEAWVREATQFLLSLDPPDTASAAYLQAHSGRLAATVAMAPLPTASRRCLELGSYLQIAPAMHCLLGYQVTAASLGPAGTKVRKAASRQGAVILDCDLDLFDVERDTFPYPDGHFELVLACELLEHLRTDPMHMLFEIYRVLERDGRILLTTPNCANLLEAAGFRIEVLVTRPGRPVEIKDIIEDLLTAYGFPTDLRGEQVYCLARKLDNASRVRFPEFLYEKFSRDGAMR